MYAGSGVNLCDRGDCAATTGYDRPTECQSGLYDVGQRHIHQTLGRRRAATYRFSLWDGRFDIIPTCVQRRVKDLLLHIIPSPGSVTRPWRPFGAQSNMSAPSCVSPETLRIAPKPSAARGAQLLSPTAAFHLISISWVGRFGDGGSSQRRRRHTHGTRMG